MSQPPSDQDEAFALIVDTSSSASADLIKVRRAADVIYSQVGAERPEQFKVFRLGSAEPVPPVSLQQTAAPSTGPLPRPCSLIAPIMGALALEGRKRSVIIVGSGEIFDLDDWAGDPRFDGWLLVKTGEQSLQGPPDRIAHPIVEIAADQVYSDVETLLSYLTRFAPEPAETPRRAHDLDAYDWQVDPTGYPLIYVEPLKAHVQLFPVAKPQFEKFIASGRRTDFGDAWYEDVLKLNPRASYRSPDVQERERLFMTGVTTDEALAFGRWLGRDYALLSAEEWRECYEWFAGRPAPPVPPNLSEALSQDALGVWAMIEGQWLDSRRQSDLRELSLMTQGILEWTVERPGRYCGLGEPAAAKLQRKADDPVRLTGAGARRLKNLGFRLRKR